MTAFHDYVTANLFNGSLPDWQQEPVDQLVKEGFERNRSLEETAYVLATAHHETARFKYTAEIGRGEARDYGEAALVWRGQRLAYYGRGYVQLTWLGNYARMSVYLSRLKGRDIDLVNNPEKAEEPEIASMVIWEGMIRGMFTGKNLADYFSESRVDYKGARRIVNGTDQDDLIAGYAREYEAALRLLGDEPQETSGCALNRSECPLSKRPAV